MFQAEETINACESPEERGVAQFGETARGSVEC